MAENPRIEELRRRVLADPASIAFAALAEEFRRVGRYDDAVDTCRTGLQRHPAYLSARVTLGRALIETGDFDGAREELETVLRSAPENLAAIRGLAQIHERLGHSAEMDPHIADMMRTMHAESIRIAAEPPPVVPDAAPQPTPDPEASLPLAPAPAPTPAPAFSMAPQPEPPPAPWISMAPAPDARLEEPTDPFAAFAPLSRPEPMPDFSFDLGAAPTMEPDPVLLDMSPDVTIAPAVEPALPALSDVEGPGQSDVEGGLAWASVEAAPVARPEARFEPAFEVVEPELAPIHPIEQEAPDAVEGPASGAVEQPDPQVLATLARLERFLGAIESLRA